MSKDPPAGVKVFVATFAHANEAEDALQTLRRLATDDEVEVVDAAVVVRGDEG